VTGYTLALSWSPAYCSHHPDSRPGDGQCDEANGRFGFIVHGLWPEGTGRYYPQWCTPAPPVPDDVARAQYCATPSPRLIAHEWAKHGTCATRDPARYFAATRRVFGALRFPDMAAIGGRRITVGRFKQLFAAANTTIPSSALAIENSSGVLHEVRICLNTALVATACPASRRGPPDQTQIVIIRP
jgi:ribonuclease T2